MMIRRERNMHSFLPEFGCFTIGDRAIPGDKSDIQLSRPQCGDVFSPSPISDLYGHLWM